MADEKDGRTGGRVTVVIAAKDEGEWVKSTVKDVLASGPLLNEVVVVDDGSRDGSCDALGELLRNVPLYVKKTPGVGVATARNLGAAEASGEFVVFMDAHSRPGSGWLDEICEVLDKGHAGAAPLIIPFSDNGEIEEHGSVLGRWYLAGRSPFHVGHWPTEKGEAVPLGCGGCQAFRLEDFQAIGGFCTELSPFGGEDTEICLRMWGRGRTIGAAPGARIMSLIKDWDARPDKDDLTAVTWINLVKAQVLHWSAGRLTAMWAAIAEEWRDHSDLFD